ncbi:MAG: single-stranded DNA-binding protein [Chloroflexales bacterium]
MARDLNKVQVIGRLGGDPEMRYTASGAAVTSFNVAAGRAWKDANGTPRDETEWFRCVAWDKLGEICNQYLTKGARVYVEGRLKTEKYTDKDGVERYSTKVILHDMIMLDSRRDAAPEIGDDDAPALNEEAPPPAAAHRPVQAGPRRTGPPAVSRNQPQPITSDDDIPF